ncbi:calcium:proton antiporter [Brachybacterium phenoliresistens]|uniref:Calcium:proton antiporter n=1 Tax=Brachybacterium phenoliresistens TaxID=396014 RepID=Z9JRV1_9MICO|nr:calcium:proton antiporter [Brachybacterium phenoliresistens]EWS81090.1 calcium:proton antiporter [Brachybacterium phenoliresistens]
MPAPAAALRSLLTPAVLLRLVLGWGAVAALSSPALAALPSLPASALAGLLAEIIAVIVLCAFGVVHQAEHLAHRLGDPYGSLVLTLSIVLIEVVLIVAVMLGPGEHATIARDSVTAVAMIIMNLVIGLCLVAGGIRHGALAHRRAGTSAYLAMILVLGALGLAAPTVLGTAGSLGTGQGVAVLVLTAGTYAVFLARQMGPQSGDFREATGTGSAASAPGPGPGGGSGVGAVLREHRGEVLGRLALLVAAVLPIVLLSHDMAAMLEDGLTRLGARPALAGLVIAMIVFLPESITAVRAALAGQMQRAVNLCHGALVSTVGLTVPAVLGIGMLTGQRVVLGESAENLMLLGITLMLSAVTFSSRTVGAIHGTAHLAVFALYVLALTTG